MFLLLPFVFQSRVVTLNLTPERALDADVAAVALMTVGDVHVCQLVFLLMPCMLSVLEFRLFLTT